MVSPRGGLARRAGISNSTISLIESDKLSRSMAVLKRSMAVLKRILDGIALDLSAFFAIEASAPVVYRAAELVRARGRKDLIAPRSNARHELGSRPRGNASG